MTEQAAPDTTILQQIEDCHAKIRELVASGKLPPQMVLDCYVSLHGGLESFAAEADAYASLLSTALVRAKERNQVQALMKTVCEKKQSWSIDDQELSARAMYSLYNNGVRDLYSLVKRTEADLLSLKNFGRKALKDVRNLLDDCELRLGMTDQEIIDWCANRK